MTKTIFTCDGCKNNYEPVTIVPTKRGEVVKVAKVHIQETKHPKDEHNLYVGIYIDNYQPFLDLCPRCEALVRTVLNIK